MKKLFIALLSLIVLATSCEDELTKLNSGTIQGIVIYENVQIIPGAIVSLYSDGELIDEVESDIEGVFSFENLYGGDYKLKANLDDLESLEYMVTLLSGQIKSQEIVFIAAPIPSTISGIVSYEDDKPLSQAVVVLYYEEEKIDSVITDETGSYSFIAENEGDFTLKAYKGSFHVYENIIVKGPKDAVFNFKLEYGILYIQGRDLSSNWIAPNNYTLVIKDGDRVVYGEFGVGQLQDFGNALSTWTDASFNVWHTIDFSKLDLENKTYTLVGRFNFPAETANISFYTIPKFDKNKEEGNFFTLLFE